MVVPRRELSRYDLLVLDPSLPPDATPTSVSIEPSQPELIEGAQRARAAQGTSSYIVGEEEKLALETAGDGQQPFALVLAPAPSMEPLYVPNRVLNVVESGGTGQTSTAGVVVKDKENPGVVGVTAALHGVKNALNVLVDGQTGTVLRGHPVTDSAFVSLSSTPSCMPTVTNGIMSNKAPSFQQKAMFSGAQSGNTSTVIQGLDWQIPTPSVYRQACVYTGRDAQPGDSGAALVTVDDNQGSGSWIVGFAFERSKPGHIPVYCSWIWAESVINGLQVEL